MVTGLNNFKEYFKDFSGQYIIIGGSACDIIISEAGLIPRATKDIDLILLVGALSSEFFRKFWEFIRLGDYRVEQQSEIKPEHFRFMNPQVADFPKEIELFSTKPELFVLNEGARLTPIPAEEDLSSLSAILLNDVYYNFTVRHSKIIDGLHIADTVALICLKIKAFINLSESKAKGEKIDSDKIKKHKLDVFRMATQLRAGSKYNLPSEIYKDFNVFIEMVKDNLPDNVIYKNMGLANVKSEDLLKLLINTFSE